MTNRRQFFASLAALMIAPTWVRAANLNLQADTQLATTWQTGNGYQTGILSSVAAGNAMKITTAIDVPTRAHGLLREPGGTLLTVARRPGNWMLRWDREGKPLAWHWIEPSRAFAGHVLASADGRTLYTTEMDLESGSGLIGVRDATSLEKQAEWPTYGIDPHQLIWDVTQPGSLIVANGGVPTRPETGRIKHNLDQMDSTLVRLNGKTGEQMGQWRLPDRRLSMRHLAWNISVPNQPVLGIALQAEHDTADEKANSPVLAVFNGQDLKTAATALHPLAGYGGDIAALGLYFAVSCPRAQGIALFSLKGEWHEIVPLSEACALTSTPQQIMAAGSRQLLGFNPDAAMLADEVSVPEIRVDNHWVVI